MPWPGKTILLDHNCKGMELLRVEAFHHVRIGKCPLYGSRQLSWPVKQGVVNPSSWGSAPLKVVLLWQRAGDSSPLSSKMSVLHHADGGPDISHFE